VVDARGPPALPDSKFSFQAEKAWQFYRTYYSQREQWFFTERGQGSAACGDDWVTLPLAIGT